MLTYTCMMLYMHIIWIVICTQFYDCFMSIFFCLIPSAGYYVKVMKKVQDKGDEYIKNEHERLGRILSELVIVKYTYKLTIVDLSTRLGGGTNQNSDTSVNFGTRSFQTQNWGGGVGLEGIRFYLLYFRTFRLMVSFPRNLMIM